MQAVKWRWHTRVLPAWHQHLRPRLTGARTFNLDGVEHPYFLAPYNVTWAHERGVELALALDTIKGIPSASILELGNVLQHYGITGHTVVDKYEDAAGTVREDIVDYHGGPFECVVAISTLEHVGYDERPRTPEKAVEALHHLIALLAPGGRLLATVPTTYNRVFDDAMRENPWGADIKYLARYRLHRWEQVAAEEALALAYGHTFRGASAIAVIRVTAAA